MTAFDVPANLAFDNYTELTTAIGEWLDRSDLTGSIPAMIALCEARLRRELQPFFSETTATVTVTAGAGTLPADCDIVRFVEYSDGQLEQVNPQHGRQFPESTAPRGFTLEGGQIRVWPICDATLTVTYQPKLPALTETTPTNDLLTQHPDAYFFGALLFAEGFVANDARASTFKALWDEAIFELKRFLSRQRRTGVRLRAPAVIV